jgi:hypothetical protein
VKINKLYNFLYRESNLELLVTFQTKISSLFHGRGKAVPLHAMETLGGRGGIASTHSRPRHYMGVSG